MPTGQEGVTDSHPDFAIKRFRYPCARWRMANISREKCPENSEGDIALCIERTLVSPDELFSNIIRLLSRELNR